MPTLNGFEVTETELAFLRGLAALDTRFLVVGMVSAVIQGADSGTRDIDLWFEDTSDGKLAEVARAVGGVFIWRTNPPCLSGKELSRLDVVTRMDGMLSFEDEYDQALECQIDSFVVRLLPLDRIIASKEAAMRPKDAVALPSLRAALWSSQYKKKWR
jgi:hypothetical protein